MALEKQKQNDTVYLAVKHHALVEESKTPREGFQPIEVRNPKTNETITKYISKYSAVEGFITRIEWYDTGKTYETRYLGYKIHIDADGQPVVLDLPFKTAAYNAFTKFAENIDFNMPVRFSAWHDRKNDGTAFCARHGEEVIRQKYTRDNPGKCPPPVHDEVTGWDFRAQQVWLKKRVDEVVIPACNEAQERRQRRLKPEDGRPERVIDPQDFGSYADDPMDDQIPF